MTFTCKAGLSDPLLDSECVLSDFEKSARSYRLPRRRVQANNMLALQFFGQ